MIGSEQRECYLHEVCSHQETNQKSNEITKRWYTKAKWTHRKEITHEKDNDHNMCTGNVQYQLPRYI